MKRRIAIVPLLLLTLAAGPTRSTARPVSAPGPALARAAQPAGQMTPVIAILARQTDLRAIGGATRRERQKRVILALQQTARDTQGGLLALLQQRQREGTVQSFTSLWVFNAIAVTASREVIAELAARPDVQRIVADAELQAPARSAAGAAAGGAVAPKLTAINAPALWNLGFRGQGVVVANLDTGVDASHPDLAAQWRGGSNSWYDPYNQHPTTPIDLNGHGTWTMGVMVARDASGTALGVAPGAQWIAARIYNDRGTATASGIHLAFQWLLDPDHDPNTADGPQVVNNSWAYSNINGCDQTFEPDLQSLAAAGITPVFAAGNYGPNASTSVSPPNNPDALPVGAINNDGVIANSSSRGPTSCGRSAPAIYPSLTAPGVSITTTDLYGGYYTASGTSLAAPHVAGAIALLLNAFPGLSVAQIESALTASAGDLGAAGPDNTFGYGRLDVLAAYNLLTGGAPTPTAAPSSTPTATPTPTSDAIFSDGFESGTLSA